MAPVKATAQIRKNCEQRVFKSLRNRINPKLGRKKNVQNEEFVRCVLIEEVDGLTPLLRACRRGYTSVVRYLVHTCGSDLEHKVGPCSWRKNLEGATPLLCAVLAGHLEIVKILLDAGARVNTTSHPIWTPLKAAAYYGYFEIVKVLIKSGACYQVALMHGPRRLVQELTPDHISITNELAGYVTLLCPLVDIFLIPMFLEWCLEACEALKLKFLMYRVRLFDEMEDREKAEDLKMKWPWVLPPPYVFNTTIFESYWSARFHKSILDGFLYIELNIPNSGLQSEARIKYIREMIALERENKNTPTMLHTLWGEELMPHSIIVRTLVQQGADVNARNESGSTPLHMAARFVPEYEDTHYELLRYGACFDMVDSEGKRAVDYLYAHRPLPEHKASVSRLISRLIHVPSLQCLAARAVCKYDVPYEDSDVSQPARDAIELYRRPPRAT
jgi:ankyrin repeat protein